MNAIYWGLTALCILDHKDALDRDEVIAFVESCWDDEVGESLISRTRDTLSTCSIRWLRRSPLTRCPYLVYLECDTNTSYL